MALSAVLDVQPDGVPPSTPPGIFLTVSGVTGDRITITRQWSGKAAIVRGFDGKPTNGSVTPVDDREVPFGVPVVYLVVCRTLAGSVTESWQTAPVTMSVSRPWISDPLAPGISEAVFFHGFSLTEVAYDSPGSVVPVVGSSLPVAVTGTRREGSEIPVTIRCLTDGARMQVEAVLRHADPVLIRTPQDGDPRYRMLPPLAYVTFRRLLVTPIGATSETHLSFTATIVAAPEPDVVVPIRTYGQDSDGRTYLDWNLQYDDYAELYKG